MMPNIDVSELLDDPDFCETLTIMRCKQVIGDNGIATSLETLIIPSPVGVVIPQPDPPLLRGVEQQTLPRLLQVHTRFRMRSASIDARTNLTYQPDVLIWNGDRFYVNKVQDYSKYGRGFIQADCSTIQTIQHAPV